LTLNFLLPRGEAKDNSSTSLWAQENNARRTQRKKKADNDFLGVLGVFCSAISAVKGWSIFIPSAIRCANFAKDVKPW
jgi:hypothetical protein